MCFLGGTGAVKTSADGPNWGHLKKRSETEALDDNMDSDICQKCLDTCQANIKDFMFFKLQL